MSEDSSSRAHRKKIEGNFCLFYVEILKEYYKLTRPKFFSVRKSLSKIRQNKNPELKYQMISYSEISNRIAYIFAYGIIHTFTIYREFLLMLKCNPTMVKRIKSLEELHFCILGGGPAVEVVAICKVINNLFIKDGVERSPLRVHVTVIDEHGDWQNDAEYLIKLAERKLFDKKYVNVDVDFVEADLTKEFSEEVKSRIKKMHFVTMVKLLSEVMEHDASNDVKVSCLVKNVLESMSRKSCLFYLDTSGGGTFNYICRILDRLPNTKGIYGPNLHKEIILKKETVSAFSNGFPKDEFDRTCTTQIKISSSVWMKIKSFQ